MAFSLSNCSEKFVLFKNYSKINNLGDSGGKGGFSINISWVQKVSKNNRGKGVIIQDLRVSYIVTAVGSKLIKVIKCLERLWMNNLSPHVRYSVVQNIYANLQNRKSDSTVVHCGGIWNHCDGIWYPLWWDLDLLWWDLESVVVKSSFWDPKSSTWNPESSTWDPESSTWDLESTVLIHSTYGVWNPRLSQITLHGMKFLNTCFSVSTSST